MAFVTEDVILWTKHAETGTGNHTYNSTVGLLQQVEVANDSDTVNLTFQVNGLNFKVGPSEAFVENIKAFSTVEITTTGAWRLICRSLEM